jgi:hypothetical protein
MCVKILRPSKELYNIRHLYQLGVFMIIVKFKQSDLKDMFLHSKLSDPITSFYEYLVLATGTELEILDNKTINVTKVVMNKSLYKTEVFDKIIMKYAKKECSFYNQERIDFAASMYDLDMGPSSSDDVPVGEIHLLDGWLRDRDDF